MMRLKSVFISAVLGFFLCLKIGHTQFVRESHLQVGLVSEVSSISPKEKFWIGLRFLIDPGWHIYWKNPGDSGLPPTLEWTLPEGFQVSSIHWPIPSRFEIPPLANYGYANEILLPMEVTYLGKNKSNIKDNILFKTKVKWLVCEKLCIPGAAQLSLNLPISQTRLAERVDPEYRQAFALARAQVPMELSKNQVRGFYFDEGSGFELRIHIPHSEIKTALTQASTKIDFFPDEPNVILHSELPRIRLSENEIILQQTTLKTPKQISGVLKISNKNRIWGWSVRTVLDKSTKRWETSPIPESLEKFDFSYWLKMIFLALLGGFLLNLMPCVFPVISVKVLGFFQDSAHQKWVARKNALWFTAGIISSFLFLATLLIGFQKSGKELGWGFQLQNPMFVAILGVIFFLIGLNFLGVFEVGSRWIGVFGKINIQGPFTSGVLATLVATPCTAPFMGASLGFALLQPAGIAFSIFLSLALGMSLPYVVLAWKPEWLKVLPKPGAWMEYLKQFLSFPLFATVIWLAWTLGLQAGVHVLSIFLGILLLIGLGLWFLKLKNYNPFSKIIFWIIFTVSIITFSQFKLQTPASQDLSQPQLWQPYSQETLEQAIRSNRTVFINFTAAWCITCQVNEKMVFNQTDVIEELSRKKVLLLRADWTSGSDTITRALRKLGRSGVPVYVLYTPAQSEPFLFPEVMTKDYFINKIREKVK